MKCVATFQLGEYFDILWFQDTNKLTFSSDEGTKPILEEKLAQHFDNHPELEEDDTYRKYYLFRKRSSPSKVTQSIGNEITSSPSYKVLKPLNDKLKSSPNKLLSISKGFKNKSSPYKSAQEEEDEDEEDDDDDEEKGVGEGEEEVDSGSKETKKSENIHKKKETESASNTDTQDEAKTKRKRKRGTKESHLSLEQKKLHHIQSEHKRREQIRSTFDTLVDLVPNLEVKENRSELAILVKSKYIILFFTALNFYFTLNSLLTQRYISFLIIIMPFSFNLM